jgi:ankyrin repeat protein
LPAQLRLATRLVARLLGEGRDVNEADETGCTTLMIVSENGHVEVVRLLLARNGVEVNKTAQDGTALYMASQNDHVEVVRLLLARKGVEVNKTSKDGSTVLFMASQYGHVEVVRLLLARKGVEVNKTAQDGFTALMTASQKGHVEVVRLCCPLSCPGMPAAGGTAHSLRPSRTPPARESGLGRPRSAPAASSRRQGARVGY